MSSPGQPVGATVEVATVKAAVVLVGQSRQLADRLG